MKWQSLIFRLLFYFVLSLLTIAVILGASFAQRFKPHLHNEILPNVERYIEYIINDIGNPPDYDTARQLSERLPFELRIEGQGSSWSSSPRLSPIGDLDFERAPAPYEHVYFSQRRRDQYMLIKRRDYAYLFAVDDGFRKGSERRHWLLLLVLGSILFLLYLAIRRMFRPIEAISRQVEMIGQGDLDQLVEVRGKGELALLADGINRMSAQIKSMLEGKSGLLLAISHELRSPITRMRVNLELLEESEIRQKLIQDIREMDALLGAILESERLNKRHAPLSLERCEMAALVAEVVKSHACRDRISSDLSPLEASVDSLRFKLLLKNLIDNACQYSSKEQGNIEITLRRDASMLRLGVRDHGGGIDADEIPRLTEAFYRPDYARQRDTGGYGLGLYLCKLIVDAHAGQLRFESRPGEGTEVIVDLPIDNS